MFKKYYRSIRTTQERRANGTRKDHEAAQWRRAKRSAANIPNSYDDFTITHQKSWKKKRKTQYRCGGRGEHHQIEVIYGKYQWHVKLHNLVGYFEDVDIPYRIEYIREVYSYYSVYHNKLCFGSRVLGFKIHWWTNKRINLDSILTKDDYGY